MLLNNIYNGQVCNGILSCQRETECRSDPLGLCPSWSTVNNHVAPGELVLMLEIQWEMKHSLLWVLLAAIPFGAGISNTVREGTLDDATSTSDNLCPWMPTARGRTCGWACKSWGG